jgi:hypothetical protein
VATRAERLVENEEAFRAANDRLSEAVGSHDSRPVPFLCECADDTCLARVELDMATYRKIRSNPRYFFRLPGHLDAPGEQVVEHRAGYDVMEKEGAA